MTEEQFIQVFLVERLSAKEARLRHGMSHRRYFDYRRAYGSKYAEELRRLKSARYAESKYGNKYGARSSPGVVLDPGALQRAIDAGHPLDEIARQFGTTRWMVRQNIEYHRLQFSLKAKLPVFIGKHNRDLLETLETLSPGIITAAVQAYEDPAAFETRAYGAHIRLLELQAFLQRVGRHYARKRRDDGSLRAITFNKNPYEARLAIGLEARGVPYAREVRVPGTALRIDFLIDERLFVEIDGEYHNTKTGKANDRCKEKRLNRPLLRFTTRQVQRDLSSVLDAIAQALATQRFSASNLSDRPLFTTSKSKRTRAT